jgi:hypothetical protein
LQAYSVRIIASKVDAETSKRNDGGIASKAFSALGRLEQSIIRAMRVIFKSHDRELVNPHIENDPGQP